MLRSVFDAGYSLRPAQKTPRAYAYASKTGDEEPATITLEGERDGSIQRPFVRRPAHADSVRWLVAAAATEAGAGSVSVNAPGTFPIVDEKITMTAFNIQVSVPDAATNSFITWYEDLTNVHIEWEHAPGDGGAKSGLCCSPAATIRRSSFPKSTCARRRSSAMVTRESFAISAGLIDEWGFFVKQAFADEPWIRPALTTPDGAIYSLPGLELGCFHCEYAQKMWINQCGWTAWGWLRRRLPTNFYEVLQAFKTQDPNQNGKADEIPLMFATSGWHSDGSGI